MNRREKYADHPPAGPWLTLLRIVLLMVFLGFGVLCIARGNWFGAALTPVGVAGVIALRTGKGPKRRRA